MVLLHPVSPLRRDPVVGSTRGLAAADGAHAEVASNRDDRALATCFQAVPEVGVVAGVGVGSHARPAHAPGPGPVEQLQGDRRLGPEGDGRGDLGLPATIGVVGPGLSQVESCGHRPGDRPPGGVAVDGDLTGAGLAPGAGVFARDPDGMLPLLGESAVVADPDAIALGGQRSRVRTRWRLRSSWSQSTLVRSPWRRCSEVPGTTWARVSQFFLGCSVSSPAR